MFVFQSLFVLPLNPSWYFLCYFFLLCLLLFSNTMHTCLSFILYLVENVQGGHLLGVAETACKWSKGHAIFIHEEGLHVLSETPDSSKIHFLLQLINWGLGSCPLKTMDILFTV